MIFPIVTLVLVLVFPFLVQLNVIRNLYYRSICFTFFFVSGKRMILFCQLLYLY